MEKPCGWVVDKQHVDNRVAIRVLINNRLVVTIDANKYRSELRDYDDRNHGFDVRL